MYIASLELLFKYKMLTRGLGLKSFERDDCETLQHIEAVIDCESHVYLYIMLYISICWPIHDHESHLLVLNYCWDAWGIPSRLNNVPGEAFRF